MKRRQKLLTDEQWELVEPLFPERRQRRDKRGRPPASNRSCFLKRPEWARRLEKIHAQGRRGTSPSSSRMARTRFIHEFRCAPHECLLLPSRMQQQAVVSVLGTEPGDVPEFGYLWSVTAWPICVRRHGWQRSPAVILQR